MTEEDAKQKWCPFTRAMAASVGTSANRLLDGAPHRGSMCIASACMAWRVRIGAAVPGHFEGQPVGFCGLAGRP